MTFTTGPAVRNLFRLAGHFGLAESFNDDVVVACVGPVCAEAAREVGIVEPVMPQHWRPGFLVRLVAEQLRRKRHCFVVGSSTLAVQGSLAVVDGAEITLTGRERAVLNALAARPGQTLTRRALLRRIWRNQSGDGHRLEVTVGRLRAKLGPAAEAVETSCVADTA